jgi:hypothetical protein
MVDDELLNSVCITSQSLSCTICRSAWGHLNSMCITSRSLSFAICRSGGVSLSQLIDRVLWDGYRSVDDCRRSGRCGVGMPACPCTGRVCATLDAVGFYGMDIVALATIVVMADVGWECPHASLGCLVSQPSPLSDRCGVGMPACPCTGRVCATLDAVGFYGMDIVALATIVVMADVGWEYPHASSLSDYCGVGMPACPSTGRTFATLDALGAMGWVLLRWRLSSLWLMRARTPICYFVSQPSSLSDYCGVGMPACPSTGRVFATLDAVMGWIPLRW